MNESITIEGGERKTRLKAGFSLLEVMIAIGIFTFGMLAIARLHQSIARGSSDAKRLTEATKLARRMIESMEQVESFNRPVNGKCQANPVKLSNITHTIVGSALLDPEAVLAQEPDPLCPSHAQPDDLNFDVELGSSKTDQEVAEKADRCLKLDAPSNSPCAPVDEMMNFGRDMSMYWVVWNLRAGYPEANMTSVRLYVVWRRMNGRRQWVSADVLLTAKDLKYYR